MLDKTILKGDLLEALRHKPPPEEDLRVTLELAFPADIAEILADLSPAQQVLILRHLDPEKAADVLGDAEEDVQRELLRALLTHADLTGILNEIAPDEGADLVALLPDEQTEVALEGLEPEQAEAIRNLARYDPETAGGIMTTEYVAVPPDASLENVLETVKTSLDLEAVSNVYVVDDRKRLVGVLSVRDILEAEPDKTVAEEMVTEVVAARLDDDQEQASRLLDRYDFSTLPVVDEKNRLKGVITIDDAMDVLEEEAEEDIALIAGSGMVTARDSVARNLKYRLPWLLVTLGGGLAAAVLVRHFEPTLGSFPELVFFMPVMAGMAGNVGIQSSTVMVRGFATGEMVLGMASRTVISQVLVGISVGTVCGILTGALAVTITGELGVGWAVAFSMTLGITGAAAWGTVLPIACERLKIDPAVAAGPVITTLNDLLGLLIYFTVATAVLVQAI